MERWKKLESRVGRLEKEFLELGQTDLREMEKIKSSLLLSLVEQQKIHKLVISLCFLSVILSIGVTYLFLR